MADIPNTEYITINADGFFVGGKPATTYRGPKIWLADCAMRDFLSLKKLYPYVQELHCLSSETPGKMNTAGNPSSTPGTNGWCRVKFDNGKTNPWVLCEESYCGASWCAEHIAAYATQHMYHGYLDLRSAVLAQELKDNDVSDIPNTEYITINVDGVFVGGKPATTYRGQKIGLANYVISNFWHIQDKYPKVAELHCLSSETLGKENTAGNPSSKHGVTQWCRVKFNNGETSSWVFLCESHPTNPDTCAYYCADHCADHVAWEEPDTLAALGVNDKPRNTKKTQDKKIKIQEYQDIKASSLDSALRILFARDDLKVKGPYFKTVSEEYSKNGLCSDTNILSYKIYVQDVYKTCVQREDSTVRESKWRTYGSTGTCYYAIINSHKYRIKEDIYKLAENYESNKRKQQRSSNAAIELAADIAFISR